MHEPNSNTDWSSRLQNDGEWDKFRGKAREEWGELTDDEIDEARGNWQQFVGTVKEKTGETMDTLERKFHEWTS